MIIKLTYNTMFKALFFFLFITSCSIHAQVLSKPDYTWAHNLRLKKNISYGEDKAQKLDVYSQNDTQLKPTLIYFHGGNWVQSSKDAFINHQFYIYFLEKGWNVVNVEYRLGKGTAPNAAQDVLCAVKWVADNAETYFIDTDKIVLLGPSAGGHLALISGLMNTVPDSHSCYVGDKIKVKAIVNWFGASDISNLNNYHHGKENNPIKVWVKDPQAIEEISREYSPIHYVTNNAPPVITIHGDYDTIIPFVQSKKLHKALDKVNVQNQLVTVPGGGHFGFTKEQFQFINEQIFLFLGSIMD